MSRYWKVWAYIAVAMVLVFYPFLMSKFNLYLATSILIFSLFGVSYYLLLGHSGLLSFGHAAYFGLGAYATAIYLIHLSKFHLFWGILLGGVCGALGGLIIGLFLLKLSKIYFALATVAFGQMLWAIAWKARSITGGDDGLAGWASKEVFIPILGTFDLGNLTFVYYFIAIVAVASMALCLYFVGTPMGNTLIALRSNPERAQFLGINPYIPKIFLFTVSAFFAGIAGALFAVFQKTISPNCVDMFTSFDIVVMSVIGGYSSFAGPILGAAVYVYLTEYLSSITEEWQLIMGIIIVLIVMFSPNGIIGLIKNLTQAIRHKFSF